MMGDYTSERSSPRKGQLRPLPAYRVTESSHTPAKESQPEASSMGTRYINRERLYYADEIENRNDRAPSQEAVVSTEDRNVLVEEAPPAISLNELGTLTPERKHVEERLPEDQVIIKTGQSMRPSEGNWVTVFGFAGPQASAVLSYFRKLGVVEQEDMGQGNWFHLKYSTSWAAAKALAKNGIVFEGSCMLGVIPSHDAIEQVSQAAESFMSPLKKESINRREKDHGGEQDIFMRPGLLSPMSRVDGGEAVRVSTAAQDLARRQQQSDINRPSNTAAVPEESIMSKTLGYVFGW